MSQYTTGEVAKLCNVSVRTVQYYDSRGILIPTALSEGGRRLYSEEDLNTMKAICFLRDIGLSINAIGDLLHDDHPDKVIALLLDQQQVCLNEEMDACRRRLSMLEDIRKGLKRRDDFSLQSITDMAHIMKNKKQMNNMRILMVCVALGMTAIEYGTILLWILKGIWWPFAVGMPLVLAVGVWITWLYYRRTKYICPACHAVFKPMFKQMFFAAHTPNTRKLTCPHCHRKGYCVEIYDEE